MTWVAIGTTTAGIVIPPIIAHNTGGGDDWGSGGDYSKLIMDRFNVDKGTADAYAVKLRNGEIGLREVGEELTRAMGDNMFGLYSPEYAESTQIGDLVLPEWFESQDFSEIQTQLKDLSSDLLEGKPPEYYGVIGDIGGEEFEKMLANTLSDVSKNVQRQKVASGTSRGGTIQQALGEEIGRTSSELRFADLLRGIQGREFLLQTGQSMAEGVRGSALTYAGQKNTFGQNVASMENQFNLNQAQLDQQTSLLNTEIANKYAQDKAALQRQYADGLISDERYQQDKADLESRQKAEATGDILKSGINIFEKGYEIYKGGTGGSGNIPTAQPASDFSLGDDSDFNVNASTRPTIPASNQADFTPGYSSNYLRPLPSETEPRKRIKSGKAQFRLPTNALA